MVYHVLNGDCLLENIASINLDGEVIIARECLIDGELHGNTLTDFWETRAKYIESVYGEKRENYFNRVAGEFEKLLTISDNSEVNLWFEHDLFCQTNLWFVISLLYPKADKLTFYIVYPCIDKQNDLWKGFGYSDKKSLQAAYAEKYKLGIKDIELANSLWIAYKKNDLKEIEELSLTESSGFHYLQQVCKTHMERFSVCGQKGRPEKAIEEIIKDKSTTDFNEVFVAFSEREGVYGFGDAQVKILFDRITNQPNNS